jgi:hypothetical protein
MGAFHRVAQDRDQPGLRDERADSPLGEPVVEVEGRRLTTQRPGRSAGEQRFIVLPPPHVLAVGGRVAGAAASGRRAVGQEELRLFDGRHEQVGMAGQGNVKRGRPRLWGADHEEVRQRHGRPPREV